MSREIIDTIEYKGFNIQIYYDDLMESPREWDNLGRMVCFHKRYTLGDEHNLNSEDFNSWEEVEDYLIKEEGALCITPVYMYDHSGITINTKGFSCPWDSGRLGLIYCRAEDILREFGGKRVTASKLKRVQQILENEVVVYDYYLTGQVYYYTVEDKDGEELSMVGCGGFYGYNHERSGLLDEAKSDIDYHIEQQRKKKQERTKTLIKHRVPLEHRV